MSLSKSPDNLQFRHWTQEWGCFQASKGRKPPNSAFLSPNLSPSERPSGNGMDIRGLCHQALASPQPASPPAPSGMPPHLSRSHSPLVDKPTGSCPLLFPQLSSGWSTFLSILILQGSAHTHLLPGSAFSDVSTALTILTP